MYAWVKMNLGADLGTAVVLRDKLPDVGARFEVRGRGCWMVAEVRRGFGVEAIIDCVPCS